MSCSLVAVVAVVAGTAVLVAVVEPRAFENFRVSMWHLEPFRLLLALVVLVAVGAHIRSRLEIPEMSVHLVRLLFRVAVLVVVMSNRETPAGQVVVLGPGTMVSHLVKSCPGLGSVAVRAQTKTQAQAHRAEAVEPGQLVATLREALEVLVEREQPPMSLGEPQSTRQWGP